MSPATPHSIYGWMETKSRQHPVKIVEYVSVKTTKVLTVNAKGGLSALLQPSPPTANPKVG